MRAILKPSLNWMLVFARSEVLLVILATFLLSDRQIDLVRGLLLLAVYAIFAAALYFVP